MKWTVKQRVALAKSIKKWERIVRSTRARDAGPDNCALCQSFYDPNCKDCPIRLTTRKSGCDETPYEAFHNHLRGTHGYQSHREPGCDECKSYAYAELHFLRLVLKASGS
jgi:hypothetical protein